MALKLLAAVHRDQAGVLRERRGRQEQIAHAGARRFDQIGRDHQPAQPPARHAAIFREAVDD